MKKKAPNRAINIHLGEDLKSRWVSYCASLGKTPGAAIKEAIEQQLQKIDMSPSANTQQLKEAETDKPEKPTKRKWVFLTPSELQCVEMLAATEGFSVAKWLVALIRNRITGTPQFGQTELELLARSNLQLLAIGRNLNQLVKVLNTTSRDPSVYRSTLSASIKEIKSTFKAHTKTISDAMIANIERWRIK